MRSGKPAAIWLQAGDALGSSISWDAWTISVDSVDFMLILSISGKLRERYRGLHP